jgi:hypothetical protein
MVGGLGGGKWVGREGVGEPGQNPKLNRRALDLVNEM